MTPAAQIDGLEAKLRQLAQNMDRRRVAHDAVVTDNEKLQHELSHQRERISTLEEKLKQPAGRSAAPVSADEREQYRQTIGQCIREIDRCLEWLQRN